MSLEIVSYDKNEEPAVPAALAATAPTPRNYGSYQAFYDFFNERLFGGRLPPCLITFRQSQNNRAYFSRNRFATRDGEEKVDEIALNARYFRMRSPKESLSTLAHEMVHLEQHHFGTPSRACYHNAITTRNGAT